MKHIHDGWEKWPEIGWLEWDYGRSPLVMNVGRRLVRPTRYICCLAITYCMKRSERRTTAPFALALALIAALAIALDRPMAQGVAGISALYPGDVGIENHPAVIFSEQFEDSIANVVARWGDAKNPGGMLFATDVPPGTPAGHALSIPWVGGVSDGGHLYKVLNPGIDDTLYVRYYVKYPIDGYFSHNGIWVGGYNPKSSWPNPRAGELPNGDDRFSAAGEQNNLTNTFEHYNYWMGMHHDDGGPYWGNWLLNNPSVTVTRGQWVCVEQMVKLNNPTTAANGEHALWLNGVKVSHLGLGFPKGFWDGGRFTQDPNGSPFEGIRWRSTSALNINYIWLQNYAPNDPPGYSGTMLFDHVVAARSYIGCLGPSVSQAPTAPTNPRVVRSS
ncbi:MAG TPA: hypothetical protein VFB92_16240 [Vicinamibacterales bacterium]|nr:hypothetical protein [Vicinamibacterales bacterium]